MIRSAFAVSLLLTAALVGCQNENDPFHINGVEDSGGDAASDTTGADTDDTEIQLTDLSKGEGCVGTDLENPPDEVLAAESVGLGAVSVSHSGVELNTCARTVGELVVDTDAAVITVTYGEDGETCDLTCFYDVTFGLVDVPDGDWTLRVGADAEIVVTID